MATRTAAAGSTTWTAAAFSGGAATTAADEIVVPTGASLTISSANTVLARSISVTGTGTLIFAATTSVVNLGDATAGTGNLAISVAAGATITITAGTPVINLISTSATQQTITTNGKTMPSLTFNGAGSSYILGDALNTLATGDIIFKAGTFDTGNFAMSGARLNFSTGGSRTITLGSSLISAAGLTFGNMSNATVTANTAVVTITLTTVSQNNIVVMNSFNWNGLSLVFNTNNQATINIAGATIGSLTINGTANQTDSYRIQGSFTCTGTFTVNGNSALNRPVIFAQNTGTPFTITAAATSLSNVDFKDITGAGAATWAITSGVVGDRGGNSNIAFTTGAATTMNTAGSTNDPTKWSGGRVPLPQDDATISGSAAITMNALCLGKNVDLSAYTGTLTLTSSSFEYELFGNITLGASMSWGANPNTFNIGLSGRGSHTITSNSKAFFPAGSNATLTIKGFGGTYTLADAFSYKTPVSAGFTHLAGGFDSAGYLMEVGRVVSNGTITRSANFRTSTVNLYITTGSTFITAAATGNTFSALSATFNVSVASSNTRSMDLGGVSIGTFNYTNAGSAGQMSFTTSGYIDTLNFSDVTNARSLVITSGQTLTIGTAFNVFGTSGKLMTVKSITGGTPAYIRKISGGPIVTDYLSVQDIRAKSPFSFWAGANSTNVSGNGNITFAALNGTFRHRQSEQNTLTGTSIGVALPAASTPGNLLVLFVQSAGTTGTVTPPSGWTLAYTGANSATVFIYYKVADGTETTITYAQVNSRALAMEIVEYSGFSGTPTLDVTDGASGGSLITSLSTTATTGVTNTAQPALALALWGAASALAASVSLTNGFLEDYTGQTNGFSNARVAAKELTSLATVETTLTWTTARSSTVSSLVVFKDVVTANGNFLMFM